MHVHSWSGYECIKEGLLIIKLFVSRSKYCANMTYKLILQS